LNAHRADILEKLASEATTEEDRIMWYKQVADTVSAATQSGGYPEGIQRLATLYQQLESAKAAPQVLAYVKYRQMLADYILNMQNPDADFAKIQDKWMADLEQFIKDYPTVSDTPEAMKQLAMALEFAGREDGAVEWYGRIVSEFPDSLQVEKARGAKRRIESIGQPLMLAGKDAKGAAVDVQSYRGKVVLVHYWASNNPYCLPGIAVLKEMQAKYGRDGFVLVGVNVDSDRAAFESYIKDNPLPWPQLHEPGGLDDSPLANAYGVLVLPTMILADKDGKIVNRNLVAETVDTELRRLLR
jgi:thiol-disulfide isomerase/thioredoxin